MLKGGRVHIKSSTYWKEILVVCLPHRWLLYHNIITLQFVAVIVSAIEMLNRSGTWSSVKLGLIWRGKCKLIGWTSLKLHLNTPIKFCSFNKRETCWQPMCMQCTLHSHKIPTIQQDKPCYLAGLSNLCSDEEKYTSAKSPSQTLLMLAEDFPTELTSLVVSSKFSESVVIPQIQRSGIIREF